MNKMKGQATLGGLIGFIIVYVIYVIGFSPVMITWINDMTGVDPLTAFTLALFVPAVLVAITIGIYIYVFGKPQIGVQQ
jgi:uncharacterized membrane protein